MSGKERKEAVKQVKISITLYSNTMGGQIKMLMSIFAEIVPLLLKQKPKHVGREGGGMQGKHRRKEEAYWTVERE